MNITALPRQRRHTLHFLDGVRAFAPVFLDTEVDMAQVVAHRAAARRAGERYSLITYVLYAAARALVAHPEANAAIRGRIRPRLAHYAAASAKLAFDRVLDGHRVVLTAILPELDLSGLQDVQQKVDHCRQGDPAVVSEFANARRLHRMPVPIGRLLTRTALRSLRRRPAMMGTFAVSSLGHGPVDSFHSVGGTTVTLGVGRVVDRPVAKDGQILIAQVMRLSLAFDHRVIDGAEAADVLADIKDRLEHFTAGSIPPPARTPAGTAGNVEVRQP